MSVVPLRISEPARRTSKPRDPPGTANIPYGYRLSEHTGRNRPSVNLTYDKQSRSPGNDAPPTANHQATRATDESPIDAGNGNVKDRNGNGADGKKLGDEPKISIGTKDTTDKQKVASQLRGQHSRGKKQEQRVAILPVNSNAGRDEDRAKETRDLEAFIRIQDFVEHTNRRIRGKKFRNLVDEGITEYEAGIEVRREKLRSLLHAEEQCLLREIIDQAQRGAVLRLEEMRKRADELRKLTEETRLAKVRDKRSRQYLERCPEARERLAKRTTLETKYSNLVQIAEKEAKREEEREHEDFWCELMLKEDEKWEARETETARRRMAAEKSIAATLEKQIAAKLALREQEKRIKEEKDPEESGENLASEESRRRRDKMARLRRDLDEQSSLARRFLAERALEEEKIDRTFRLLGEAEMARETAASEEKASRLRREIAAYMASLDEFKHEEARRRAEIDAIVAAHGRKIQAQREQERQKTRENRESMMRKVLEVREQQLSEKRVNEAEQARRVAYENELRLREAEAEALLTAEAESRKREAALRYGQELKAQRECTEMMRRREKENIERVHLDDLERERECERLAERAMNEPEIITPRAFEAMLKECATRRDGSKQKALCSHRSRSSA